MTLDQFLNMIPSAIAGLLGVLLYYKRIELSEAKDKIKLRDKTISQLNKQLFYYEFNGCHCRRKKGI